LRAFRNRTAASIRAAMWSLSAFTVAKRLPPALDSRGDAQFGGPL
jgi:hypothetical protein